jgi:WD40 repeat protein
MQIMIFHTTLASFFASKPLYLDEPTRKKPNTRKLVEQPWQQTKGEMWNEVTNTLCNLDFIQAKAAAKMTYELVNDFNTALEVIPDNAENIRKEKERQARMDRYTRDLIACAKGEITRFELEIPESIIPWTKEQTEAEIERIKSNPNRNDKLRDFIHFLGQEASNLQNYVSEFAYFTYQQSWNFSNEGFVPEAAKNAIKVLKELLFLRMQPNRPEWNPLSPIKKKLFGHIENLNTIPISPGSVNSVDMTPDGRFAISGASDKTCILWNLENGKPIRILKGHYMGVSSVAITPDGKRAISGSHDNSCILWDLESGVAIKTLDELTSNFNAISITPDGKRAISDSDDNSCILWDLESGVAIKTLNSHTSAVYAISITPDGKRAISGSDDNSCILWDLESGVAIKTLNSHTSAVKAVSITPDGKRAISGSKDNSCILWDLESGIAIKTLGEHNSSVEAVSITSDGKRAISASNESYILWDLINGESNIILTESNNFVHAVSITPDGNFAILALSDNSCILLDITFKLQNFNNWHSEPIDSISITSDGKFAFSSSLKERRIWDIKTGCFKKYSKKIFGREIFSCITPDNKRVVIGTWFNEMVFLDFKTVQKINSFRLNGKIVKNISITPDGQSVVIATTNNNIFVWNLKTGDQKEFIYKTNSNIEAISITPDGKTIVAIFDDLLCFIWNFETREEIIRFSYDLNFADIIDNSDKTSSKSVIKKEYLKNIRLVLPWEKLYDICVTPDGKAIAYVSNGELVINIRNIKTGMLIQKLTGHKNPIKIIRVTPDGEVLISYSEDKTCIIWKWKTGVKVAIYPTIKSISDINVSKNNIVAGFESGEFAILNIGKKLISNCVHITTIRKIWDFEMLRNLELSADCTWCGHRFVPHKDTIQTVINILRENNIQPEQSPCFELPEEAWEHLGLLGECPKCHEKLKFNPFFGSDMKEIIDCYTTQEREQQYQNKFDEAEKAFKEENWDEAYSQYLKLVQQGKFDANDLRYQMALCRLNSLTFNNPEIISDINILIQLLKDKKANDKAQIIADKLKERLDAIKQEELAKKKAEAPWWKKMFGN